LSTLASRSAAEPDFSGLRQHALERGEVHGFVFCERFVDLGWEGLGVVDGGIHLGQRPAKMRSDGRGIALVAANEQHNFPHGEAAALNARLAAGG